MQATQPTHSSLTDSIPKHELNDHPRGRDAIAAFPNNITNIDPNHYRWVPSSSNHTLCHKGSGLPKEALFWLVGDIDTHSLSTATPYESWTVDIRLPPATDKALNRLLKTGPWKVFTPPNPYSILRVKATLKAVQEDLMADEDENLAALGDTIRVTDPYPFTHDGTMLREGASVPCPRYEVWNFDEQSLVAVEVSFLGYHLQNKDPGYSVRMRNIYHLWKPPEGTPATPAGKRKGGCIVSPRRRKDGVFNPDPSKPV